MLKNEVTIEQVDYIAENLFSYLDPYSEEDERLFDEAFQLYRKGSIYNTSVSDEVVTATVFDEKAQTVKLDVNFFQLSECTCPKMAHLCRHKLAAFFYIYAGVGQLGDLVSTWQKKLRKRKVKEGTRKPLAQPQQRAEVSPVFEAESLEQWLRHFQEIDSSFQLDMQLLIRGYSPYQQRTTVQRIATDLFDACMEHAPQTGAARPLYKIHAAVYCVIKIGEHLQLYERPMAEHAFDRAQSDVSELVGQIGQALNSLTRQPLPSRYEQLVVESLDYFDDLLDSQAHDVTQYVKLFIYRELWTKWLSSESAWMERHEQKLLEKLQDTVQNEEDSEADIALRVALVHLAYLRGDDRQAFERAKPLQNGWMNYFFYPIELSCERGEMKRMRAWLDFTTEGLQQFLWLPGQYREKRHLTDSLLHFYWRYSELSDSPAVYESALKALLPYSFYDYNDHLLSSEQYRTWAELQLLVGFQPERFSRDELREIEKKDRACLLPLYHQAVENAIAERKRDSYKLAVKRLKKLRTHYRQLKKVDRWQTYIQQTAQKYKRLRAFQEELQKGKLLHD